MLSACPFFAIIGFLTSVFLNRVQAAAHFEFKCKPGRHADDAVAIALGGDHFLPVFATHHRGKANVEAVEDVLIVVHDSVDDAELYFEHAAKEAALQKKSGGTLVLTPIFGNKPCRVDHWIDTANYQRYGGKHVTAPYWIDVDAWTRGSISEQKLAHSPLGVSSFSVMDALTEWVQKEYSKLSIMVATGFGTSADFLVRWAAMSPEGSYGKAIRGNIPLRIMCNSPTTYMYFDEKRPSKKCFIHGAVDPDHLCQDFISPGNGPENCGGTWDDYRYGLKGLQRSSTKDGMAADVSEYVRQNIEPDSTTETKEELISRFTSKDIRFLFGVDDTLTCDDNACSSDCAAMLQGPNVLQRGLNFMSHLKDVRPGYKPKFGICTETRKWPWEWFVSPYFVEWAFLQNKSKYSIKPRVVANEGPGLEDLTDKFYPTWECQERCDKNPKCNSFAYNPYSGACHLKERCVTSNTKLVKIDAPNAVYQTYWRRDCTPSIETRKETISTSTSATTSRVTASATTSASTTTTTSTRKHQVKHGSRKKEDGHPSNHAHEIIDTKFLTKKGWHAMKRLAKAQGTTISELSDRHYSARECQVRCDSTAGCHSFTYVRRAGHCQLKDRCVEPEASMVEADDGDAQTYYRTCAEAANLCHRLEDRWDPGWGLTPKDSCTQWLHDQNWGKAGLFVDCRESWVADNCALSCCNVWGSGLYEAGGYRAFQRVVNEGSSVGNFIDRWHSVAECEGECNRNQKCRSFTYSVLWGHCHLKDLCVSETDTAVPGDSPMAYYRTYSQQCEMTKLEMFSVRKLSYSNMDSLTVAVFAAVALFIFVSLAVAVYVRASRFSNHHGKRMLIPSQDSDSGTGNALE